MKKQKSTIEQLEMRRARLLILKQSKKDKMEEANSKAETKIKVIENRAYRKKVKNDTELAEIDRELNKIVKLIEVEKQCANEMTKKED